MRKNKNPDENLIDYDNSNITSSLEQNGNDILIITPEFDYPNRSNINTDLVNTILGYKNFLSFDLIVVNDNYVTDSNTYTYKDLTIIRTGYNKLRNLLLNKKYKKILIHRPNPTYYKILNSIPLHEMQIILYSYGDDLFKDIPALTDKYCIEDNKDIYDYNKRNNFQFVFQNEKQKMILEKKYNIVFNNVRIYKDIKEDIKQIKKFKETEKIYIPSKKRQPLLSISIAAFNVEKYIIQLLCHLLRSKYSKDIEVLIINDGSSDNISKVVKDFIKKHYTGKKDSIIRLINKENKGHGSTINTGVDLATGKYFKLLDGDDYYVTNQFDKFMEFLKLEDSDLILTEYYEDISLMGKFKKTNLYNQLIPKKQYIFSEIYGSNKEIKWGPLLHTSCYKTKLLKKINFKIDENCFYVDNEFNLMGVIATNTMTFYPLYVYSYYIGRSNQSISIQSYKQNIKQYEKVVFRIIDEVEIRKDTLDKEKIDFIKNKVIINLIYVIYEILTKYFNDKSEFLYFDNKLKQYKEYYNNKTYVGRRIKLLRKTRGKFYNLITKTK